MATFKHERECRCLDKETDIRIFWLDIENPGRAYACLSPEYVTSAANQFHRYGILEEMELPSPVDDRISEITFECDRRRWSKRCLRAVSAWSSPLQVSQ
jgi:hypothetical protein